MAISIILYFINEISDTVKSMKIPSYIFFMSFFIGTVSLLSSQTMQDSLEISIKPDNVMFSLSEPKRFTLIIKNKGAIAQSLYLTDNIIQNITVDVFDEIDSPVPVNTTLASKRQVSQIAYRNFTLNPSEVYSIPFYLDDFVNIGSTGVYRISVKFFPRLYTQKNKDIFYASNTVLVSMLEFISPMIFDNNNTTLDEISDISIIKNNANKPDDVVNMALTFLQQKNWENFIKVVDLQMLYLNTSRSPQVYNTLTREQQQAELVQYAARLSQVSDNDDLIAPDYFRIDKTQYTDTNATVTTITHTVIDNATMVRRYQFYLKKIKTHWKIVDYSIQVIGLNPTVSTPQKYKNLVDTEYLAPDDMP